MDEMRFDGQVALVTGAGRGMGRNHALLLARRGAKVVVNDYGVAMDGSEPGAGPAESVAQEIIDLGGEAIADTGDVSSPEAVDAMVGAAIRRWGRLDIVIHNAGIVTFFPFGEMTYREYRRLVDIHLDGGFLVSRAAWPHMVKQKSGKIILVTSAAALFGLPASAHYGAAKTGLVGLARALSLEGRAFNIDVNALDVLAYTRLMEGFFSGDEDRPQTGMQKDADWWKERLSPEHTSPVAAWLAHPDCKVSGEVISTVGGRVCHQYITMTEGFTSPDMSPETIAANAAAIFARDPHTNEFADAGTYLRWQVQKIIEADEKQGGN